MRLQVAIWNISSDHGTQMPIKGGITATTIFTHPLLKQYQLYQTFFQLLPHLFFHFAQSQISVKLLHFRQFHNSALGCWRLVRKLLS